MNSVIIFCAKYLFLGVILLILLAWLRVSRHHKITLIAAVVLAGIIAVILDKIAGKLYYDPRPFVTHNVKPLVTHAADNGFPSEHTVLTFTLSLVTYFFSKKIGVVAFLVAILVGIGRVAAHVHSPIDIIGGIIIGLVSGWAGYNLAVWYLDRKKT